MKSFTSLAGLARSDLEALIASAIEAPNRGSELAGRAVALLFFEDSTRTRLSFDLAACRLGADVLRFDPRTSSTSKGETLKDTVATVSAIGSDLLVVRHSEEGVPDLLHEWTGKPVINAGDGSREHPTQGLADAVTLVGQFGDLEGLKIGVVGDIAHSRVAGSLVHALPTLGAELTLVGPNDLLPDSVPEHVEQSHDLDSVLPSLDVVYLLRVQRERGATLGTDYTERYQLTGDRAAAMKESAVVMHPGPMNRGVEIEDEVADGPRSLILAQVANGVPARMAVMRSLAGSIQ